MHFLALRMLEVSRMPDRPEIAGGVRRGGFGNDASAVAPVRTALPDGKPGTIGGFCEWWEASRHARISISRLRAVRRVRRIEWNDVRRRACMRILDKCKKPLRGSTAECVLLKRLQ